MKNTWQLCIRISCFLILFTYFLSVNILHAQQIKEQPDLVIWDDKPAKVWMTDAYPIGNGRIGGMVFGGVKEEHIQFNENSLWTGDETETGAYQAFGNLYVDFGGTAASSGNVSSYKRQLDIANAIQQISYTANGTSYKRDYFCSFPDRVMVLRYTASRQSAYSATIKLKDAHGAKVTSDGTRLTIIGKLENGMAYCSTLQLKTEGGSAVAEPDGLGGFQLKVINANAFTILLSAATDYSNQRSQQWKGEAPELKVNRMLEMASAKKYRQLLTTHVKDYQGLFNRVSLNLGTSPRTNLLLPTAQRLFNYKSAPDSQLETLIYQYGRYLLISSSRKGGLPANLQGLWNESNSPPWRSDYHSNINVQMNYWLAEPANLSECHFPYLEYINSMREVKKENTRKKYPGVRGWTVKTENNIFGGESFLWNTPGSAWYVQAIWEHYAFTKDKVYLKNFGYPILKEVTEFWDDYLKRRPDGILVAPMGWSPEHGPTEDGVSYDQQIVYDLFTNYVDAANALGIDNAYRDRVLDLRGQLLKPKIGKWGQLQEWEADRDDPKDNHRHVSHLFGLHPGRQFSTTETPELVKAAKVSLLARGDVSTGWSMAWKINFWARLHDAEHAYLILKNFIKPVGGSGVTDSKSGGIYANLFCAHPPFQIDGNFGYTAGVTEMLMQSQTSEIELLPALPAAWASGSMQGLRARGNFEIADMQWKNGEIFKLSIRSWSGGDCQLRVPNALKAGFVIKNGEDKSGYTYSFKTVAGRLYHFVSDKKQI